MSRPLEGFRVLDLTWGEQGPFATVLLSDMGAEIIKVEGREGERGRWGTSDMHKPVPYFVAHDRGKNSITLHARPATGQAIALKLAERADVAVSNMRPGIMEKLGLGYEDMKR